MSAHGRKRRGTAEEESAAAFTETSGAMADQIVGLQQGNNNVQHIHLPGHSPRQIPLPFRFRIPGTTGTFTARTGVLADLNDGWPPAATRAAIQVVTGLPGVGKTQVAAAYVDDHLADYSLVAWIRAADPVTDFAALADQLGVTDHDDTVERRAETAVLTLAAWDRPWLLVLDNVDDPDVLRTWCPPSGLGRVLVTARDRTLTPEFGREVRVEVFTPAEAVDYVLQRSGRRPAGGQDDPVQVQEAADVAAALGRLPLALAHAGAYCATHTGTTFAAYLRLLHALPAVELFQKSPELFYAETVASTWAVSIAAASQRAPLAGPVLGMAAMVDPDAIPLDFFDVLVPDDGESKIVRGRHRLNEAIHALLNYSLADMVNGQLAVHRLLQKVVTDALVANADTTPARHATTALRAALPSDSGDPSSWPQWQALVAHTIALAHQPNVLLKKIWRFPCLRAIGLWCTSCTLETPPLCRTSQPESFFCI